jgi:hypothetical protein
VKFLLGLVLCAWTLFVASCSQQSGSQEPTTLELTSGGPLPGFLERIPKAPFTTRYYARRRILQNHQSAGGAPQVLEYTERVWSNGQGGFRVEPEQLIQPPLPASQANLFLLLQSAREGFMYRVRDFRVQDLYLFLRGYQLQVTGSQISVAGQACERLRVTRTGTSGYHELDVSPHTGLILRCVEFDANGAELGRLDTLEYSPTPDLSQVTLHQDLPAQDLDLANTQPQLGFQLLAPSFIPSGYELTKAERVDLSNETWARLSYTDGAEQLFFLHRRIGGGLTVSDLLAKHNLRVFKVGPWTLLDATANNHRFLVAGRLTKDQLQMMVESAIP